MCAGLPVVCVSELDGEVSDSSVVVICQECIHYWQRLDCNTTSDIFLAHEDSVAVSLDLHRNSDGSYTVYFKAQNDSKVELTGVSHSLQNDVFNLRFSVTISKLYTQSIILYPPPRASYMYLDSMYRTKPHILQVLSLL